jgi:hypothetical protein
MITFSQFAERLAHGQLKNTAAVEDNNPGVICPTHYDKILTLTNQGLTDLCARFPLIERQVDLILDENRNTYLLNQAGLDAGYLDITQTEAFIPEEFIGVRAIYDADGKRHAHDSGGHIITPTYDSLRFTKAKIDELKPKIRIEYKANHAEVQRDGVITIPPNMVTSLQLFVASLFLSHMNGPEHTTKGDSYYAAYLRHIGEDTQVNASSTSEIDEDTRFRDRGFV